MSADGQVLPGDGEKSQLLNHLERLSVSHDMTEEDAESRNNMNRAIIIDGMTVVQQLTPKPVWVKTGNDLATSFLRKIDSMVAESDANQVRLVFDTYKEKSLKAKTRQKRMKNKSSMTYFICDTTKH